MGYFDVLDQVQNCSRVYLYSATFIFCFLRSEHLILSRVVLTFFSPNGLFLSCGNVFKKNMGFNHKAETLVFSVLPLITTFVFGLVLGSFRAFWSPYGQL